MSHSRTSFRLTLLRWHRRTGLAVATLVLALAITGLLLNHTEELDLDERYVESNWLLNWYGIETSALTSYRVGEQWVSARDGMIYLDSKPVHQCNSEFSGAVSTDAELLIACRQSLALLTPDGAVIERIDATLGLPTPVDGLLTLDAQVLIRSGSKAFRPDLDQLAFVPVSDDESKVLLPERAPEALIEQIEAQSASHSIHWERVLLDLHSGRLFGKSGVYLFDLAAVLLIFLAGSGFYYWASKPGPRR